MIAGNASPICGPIWHSCGRIPARNCCSWAANSASGANGTMTARLWHLLDDPIHRGVQSLVARPQRGAIARNRRCTVGTPARRFSLGGRRRSRAKRVRLAAHARECPAGPGRREHHAGTTLRLPHWCSVVRYVARNAEQRCDDIWGFQVWATVAAAHADATPWQGQPASLSLTLPPLATVLLMPEA